MTSFLSFHARRMRGFPAGSINDHFYANAWNTSHWCCVGAAFASSGTGEYCVVTKRYVARQVAALLEFSKLTRDTALSVALIQRAADLKLRSDEAARDDGNDLRAPDVLLGK